MRSIIHRENMDRPNRLWRKDFVVNKYVAYALQLFLQLDIEKKSWRFQVLSRFKHRTQSACTFCDLGV